MKFLTGGALGTRETDMVGSLFKRTATTTVVTMGRDQPLPRPDVAKWVWLVLFLVVFASVPIFAYIHYTLNTLITLLAMVEDSSPPSYEPLSQQTQDAQDTEAAVATGAKKPQPVTSSVPKTKALLHSISGYRSLFRGMVAFVAYAIALSLVQSLSFAFIKPILGFEYVAHIVSQLVAILATLPLATAWVHIAMSTPKMRPWYKRIPNVRKTFSALWRPSLILWAAVVVTTTVPYVLIQILGFQAASEEGFGPGLLIGTITIPGVVGLVLALGLVVPARMILVRIQASLLPLEDEPIISFDRSFKGAIEPEIVGGRGYATLSDAWNTFAREDWHRLIKLYYRITVESIVTYFLACGLIIALFYLLVWASSVPSVAGVYNLGGGIKYFPQRR